MVAFLRYAAVFLAGFVPVTGATLLILRVYLDRIQPSVGLGIISYALAGLAVSLALGLITGSVAAIMFAAKRGDTAAGVAVAAGLSVILAAGVLWLLGR
ncbi:MAG: hypothetical protein H8F28_10885 [Fibrella sp.]|nr:hypothetical protein [Armatimonadota bacterium]